MIAGEHNENCCTRQYPRHGMVRWRRVAVSMYAMPALTPHILLNATNLGAIELDTNWGQVHWEGMIGCE